MRLVRVFVLGSMRRKTAPKTREAHSLKQIRKFTYRDLGFNAPAAFGGPCGSSVAILTAQTHYLTLGFALISKWTGESIYLGI